MGGVIFHIFDVETTQCFHTAHGKSPSPGARAPRAHQRSRHPACMVELKRVEAAEAARALLGITVRRTKLLAAAYLHDPLWV